MLSVRQRVHAFLWAYRLLARSGYPHELDSIKGTLEPDDVCIDVGAHSGNWSYPLSKLVRRVYAFEALPYYSEVLRVTMAMLGARNVEIIGKAASDRTETASLVWQDEKGKRLTGFTHVAAVNEEDEDVAAVETVSLDSFFAAKGFAGNRLAFIKCDVEGYECHVLSGSRGLIDRWRPLIFAEAKDQWFGRYGKTSKDLFDILAPYGYCGYILREDGSEQEVTALNYSGSGDILFRPPGLEYFDNSDGARWAK